jgi:hypothetical protein
MKRTFPLILVLTSLVVQLSEQCMQTPQGKLTSEVISVGPGATEVISVCKSSFFNISTVCSSQYRHKQDHGKP